MYPFHPPSPSCSTLDLLCSDDANLFYREYPGTREGCLGAPMNRLFLDTVRPLRPTIIPQHIISSQPVASHPMLKNPADAFTKLLSVIGSRSKTARSVPVIWKQDGCCV